MTGCQASSAGERRPTRVLCCTVLVAKTRTVGEGIYKACACLPPSTYSHSWATTAFTRTTTKVEGDEKRCLVLSRKISASKSSMGASYRGGSYSMPWVLVRRGNTVLYQGYQRVQRVVGEVRVALQSSSGEMEFRRLGWHFENPILGDRANKKKCGSGRGGGGSKELLAPWPLPYIQYCTARKYFLHVKKWEQDQVLLRFAT